MESSQSILASSAAELSIVQFTKTQKDAQQPPDCLLRLIYRKQDGQEQLLFFNTSALHAAKDSASSHSDMTNTIPLFKASPIAFNPPCRVKSSISPKAVCTDPGWHRNNEKIIQKTCVVCNQTKECTQCPAHECIVQVKSYSGFNCAKIETPAFISAQTLSVTEFPVTPAIEMFELGMTFPSCT